MTSAPISASIIPAVGPAMICASSSTRIPFSGPLTALALFGYELRLLFREERCVTDSEVFGVEAIETFIEFLRRQRRALRQAPGELLVPARDKRCTLGDTLGSCARFASNLLVGHDARHKPFLLRFGGIEDPAFQQNLERNGCPDESHQWCHLGVCHHQTEILDRRSEATRFAANAQIGERCNLKSAANTNSMNLRDQRMPAICQRIGGAMHHLAVLDCLLLVRSLARKLGDVVAWRERFLARTTDDHTAQ